MANNFKKARMNVSAPLVMSAVWQNTPRYIIDRILDLDKRIVYRHGKYMNRLAKDDPRFEIISSTFQWKKDVTLFLEHSGCRGRIFTAPLQRVPEDLVITYYCADGKIATLKFGRALNFQTFLRNIRAETNDHQSDDEEEEEEEDEQEENVALL